MRDPSVADDQVELAELLDHPVQYGRHRLAVGDVGANGQRRTAAPCGVLVDVDCAHLCALVAEQPHLRKADPGGCTGDKRDRTREISHRTLSSTIRPLAHWHDGRYTGQWPDRHHRSPCARPPSSDQGRDGAWAYALQVQTPWCRGPGPANWAAT